MWVYLTPTLPSLLFIFSVCNSRLKRSPAHADNMLPRRFEVQYAPLTDTSLKTSMDPVHGRMKACHFGLEATGFKVTPIAAAAQLFTGPSDTLMVCSITMVQ